MTPDRFADLEIGLHRREKDSYTIELRFSQPGSEAESRVGTDEPAKAALDLDQLRQLSTDPANYGQALSAGVFAEDAIRTAFIKSRAIARALDAPLRVRLLIGPTAPDLHALHWETLTDPETGTSLSTSENVLFSRYLSSQDWTPVKVNPKGTLRGLVVVANPTNLAEYNLDAVDVAGELQRVKTALGEIPLTVLPDLLGGVRATADGLIASLREEQPDYLYLVCHGSLIRGQPWLWLEGEDGTAARLSGEELVTRLGEMQVLPRLVVLASCESAGAGEGEALHALGPRLAAAGIPAVIAMQGKISMTTIAQMMPAFFQELLRGGQVDHALAVARGVVRAKADVWMPALFMRLKSGRIWSDTAPPTRRGPTRDPESLAALAALEDYPREIAAMKEQLASNRLVFFLGPDFPAALSGIPALQDLADELAAREGLAAGQRLAAVAQQAMSHGNRRAFTEFIQQKWETTDVQPGPVFTKLAYLIKKFRPELIITTAYHRLLEWSLRDAGDLTFNKIARDTDLPFADPNRPTLLKLYGDLDQPDTLVVTEQDQNALARGKGNPDMVDEVRRAFRRNSVLFLGQDPTDPALNILFDEVAGDRFQAKAYAVWTGLTAREIESFKGNRGLDILVLDPVSLLEELDD
jgi:hypothetical protein